MAVLLLDSVCVAEWLRLRAVPLHYTTSYMGPGYNLGAGIAI
jgi:hypothetical protein